MAIEAQNLVIIMDDEHSRKVLGAYGNALVQTPNIDALARAGARFNACYTPSPICVPARGAFAVGDYVHRVGTWDNANAYTGTPRSWAYRLRAQGHEVVSIGKLHYASDEVDGGFTQSIIPMHIEEGVGDLYGLIRSPLPVRHQSRDLARRIGPGETTYIQYDRNITLHAEEWIRAAAERRQSKPWVLFLSYISPHSPLVAPPEFYALYENIDLPRPKHGIEVEHPWLTAWNECYRFDEHFGSDEQRMTAIRSYYGLCSFADANVGRVVRSLDETGLRGSTRIMLMSDHGTNLGARGYWGKSTMYEESVNVPLIMVGKDIPAGTAVDTPVSLLDICPTIFEAVGAADDATGLPGASLFGIANAPYDDCRLVISEYHAAGSISGCFMLRRGNLKYIHYVGMAPALYDLSADPEELHDIASDPARAGDLIEFRQALLAICDPVAVDAQAKAVQQALIAQHGGAERILRRGGRSYTPVPGEQLDLIGNEPQG
jgi:choline-sulfatase